ncbi:hypothetical protein JCM5350_000352 [Sporobolomyces pararoseus]
MSIPPLYLPFPPSTSTSTPSASHSSNQTHALWIAALALPLVIVLSGLFVAFLCWRRLRINPSPERRWGKLDDSPPCASNDHQHHPEPPLPPSTRPFPRPLVLLARTRSDQLLSPATPNRQMSQRPSPPSSNLSFPSVSTKVTANGKRVLTKKKGRTWPPRISWPLELETFNPVEERNEEPAEGRSPEERNVATNGGTDLERGPSLVSGYHSQSNHNQQQIDHLELLVEEARGTRHSWTEGDDEVEQHFSTFSNLDQQQRAQRPRVLSSRSLSEYSHLTMGATTLGNLIDREVARIQDLDSTSLHSNEPSLGSPPVATTQPLSIERTRSTSADLYSLRPVSFVPFPRLPPIARTPSHPDLPSTPSTFCTVVNSNDEFRLPPPLPYDHYVSSSSSASRLVPDGSSAPPPPPPLDTPIPPPSAWIRQYSHQRIDQELSSTGLDHAQEFGGERGVGGGTGESLIEWRQVKMSERKKERERAQEKHGEWSR